MPETPQVAENIVKIMAILTAIPVILFALWAEYYGEHLKSLGEKEPDYDRAPKIRSIRAAGLYVMVLQTLMYALDGSCRKDHPIVTTVCFALALWSQWQIQMVLERKIQKVEQVPSIDRTAMSTRAITWFSITTAFYLVVSFFFTYGSLFLGFALKLSIENTGMLVILGIALGVSAVLGLNFLLGPLQLRMTLPVAPLKKPDLEALIQKCFRRAGVSTPSLWVIELSTANWNNAMVSGFSKATGLFKSGFFMTRSMIDHFSERELEAVILHEVSHVALGHLKRRMILSFASILGSIMMVAFCLAVSYYVLPSAWMGIVRTAGLISMTLLPLKIVFAQMHRHELEADLYSVQKLGGDVEALVMALLKIDASNGRISKGRSTHPSTQQRIDCLRATTSASKELPQDKAA